MLLFTYPEEGPFDRTPPVPNISPKAPSQSEQTTSEEEARASLRKCGLNPWHEMYGHNPLSIHDRDLRNGSLPLGPYTPPPPLCELHLDGFEFIELMNPGGRTPVYKVRLNGEFRVLKLVRRSCSSQ